MDKRAIIFAHDDPDGIASAAILCRYLKKAKTPYYISFPHYYELTEKELKEVLKKVRDPTDLYIVDKGTINYYQNYKKYIRNIIIVDHHQVQGVPKNCTIINPNISGKYILTSTSYLMFNYVKATSPYDEFLTLIGLKSDWVINPTVNFTSPYCKNFYLRCKSEYPNLFKRMKSSPTLFDTPFTKYTTLLNKIAEFYFSLTGGGFQYFYLKNLNQPRLAFDVLLKEVNVNDITTLDEYIGNLPNCAKCQKIYSLFLKDWEKSYKKFDSTILFDKINGIKIFLFIGEDVPLMPFVGSFRLCEFSKNKKAAIIMINKTKDPKTGIHFSFRSNTDELNVGKLATLFTEKLILKYNNRGVISGGGHPRAAECKTRSSNVPFQDALKIFLDVYKSFSH